VTFAVKLIDVRTAFINSMMVTASGKTIISPPTNQEYEEMHGFTLQDADVVFKSEEEYAWVAMDIIHYRIHSNLITIDITDGCAELETWLLDQGAILLDFQEFWYTKHWRVTDDIKLLFLLRWT
jgi:hypothetical protein